MSNRQVAPSDVLIGREQELDQLMRLLGAARERRAGTAMVSGEPGVGKSRLLREFGDRARGSAAHVLRGGCVNLGAGTIPYAPLIDALRRMVREHGEAAVRQLGGPAYAELAGLISDFTGSAPATEVRSQLHVFGAVLRLLDHIGANAPAVLIFEDMHWADESTLDLVAYLVRAKTDERLLLVYSYRSDTLPRGAPLLTLLAEPDFLRHVERIELARFTRAELRRYVDTSVPGPVDPALMDRYVELSEGNAFFAEELLRAGALTDRTKPLPSSLRDVMLSRIAQVGTAAAVAVLQVVAAVGRKVGHRLLATVSELPRVELNAGLRECVGTFVLAIDPTDKTYGFRHALLREAVYQDLLPGEQAELHAAIAAALDADVELSLAENEMAEAELAYHWLAAGETRAALRASMRAGDAARRMRAFKEAEIQYARVLALWHQVPDAQEAAGMPHERVLAEAADTARWAGNVTQAVEHVRSAIAEVDPAREPHRAGELHERLGSYLWEAARSVESELAFQEAERLLAGHTDGATVRVLVGLALAAARGGRYPEARDRAGAAVAMARTAHDLAAEGRALNALGVALAMDGAVDDGVAACREALRIAEEVDQFEDLYRARANLGVVLERAGQLAEAARVARAGWLRLGELKLGGTRQAAVLANNLSATLILLGEWDEAVALVEEILSTRPVAETLYPRLTLAEVEVARGRFEEADRLLAAVRSAPASNDPRFLGPLHTCEAELALWRFDIPAAWLAVSAGLAAIDDKAEVISLLRLYAVGLRTAADERVSAPLTTSARVGQAANADALIGLVRQAVADERVGVRGPADERVGVRGPADERGQPELAVLHLLCEAERARVDGTDTAAMWGDVADAWRDLDRPYPSAYARWREADAATTARDDDRAGTALRVAHELVTRLGAAPLGARIGRLVSATRTELAVTGPAPAEAPAVRPNRYGLTSRELEVLRLLSEGRTDREIGEQLSVAARTAGTHVTNLLRKLGVHNRAAAASLAHQAHLLDDPDDPAAGRSASGDHAH